MFKIKENTVKKVKVLVDNNPVRTNFDKQEILYGVEVESQRARTSGGACGLIRCNAKNLTKV